MKNWRHTPLSLSPRFQGALLFLLTLFLLLPVSLPAFAWEARFVSAADGDSFVASRNGRRERIRLYGIDAPEGKQAFGNASRQSLIRLLQGKTLDVRPMYTDPYRRIVAVVFVRAENTQTPDRVYRPRNEREDQEKVCVNEWQIRNGMAWFFTSYCRESFCAEWKALEKQARARKIGLWRDERPMPPQEWRRRHPRTN